MNKIIFWATIFVVVMQIALSIIILVIYGNPYEILITTPMNILTFLFLHWVSRHPAVCNYPQPIKNKDIAYKTASRLAQMLALWAVL